MCLILIYCATISEMDFGGVAIEVEPSFYKPYFLHFSFYNVTDITDVADIGLVHTCLTESAYETEVHHRILPCRKIFNHTLIFIHAC